MCRDFCAILTCRSCTVNYGTPYKNLDVHCYGKLSSAQLWPFETNRASVNKVSLSAFARGRSCLFPSSERIARHRFPRKNAMLTVRLTGRELKSQQQAPVGTRPEHDTLLSPPCVSRCISLHACCLRCTVCGKSEEGLVTTRYKCLQLEIIQQWESWLVTWMKKKMHHENLLVFKLTFKCTVSVSASTTMHTVM